MAVQSDYANNILANQEQYPAAVECEWMLNGRTAPVLLFTWHLCQFFEWNVSFQCTPIIHYSGGESTETESRNGAFVCVHLCIPKPLCSSRFHLWFAPTHPTPLSKCLSVTALFVLLESLQNGVPSRGPFVCRFDYERAISPRGRIVSSPRLQQVCAYIFVCVCERAYVLCKVTNAKSQK